MHAGRADHRARMALSNPELEGEYIRICQTLPDTPQVTIAATRTPQCRSVLVYATRASKRLTG